MIPDMQEAITIWQYDELSKHPHKGLRVAKCVFCDISLKLLTAEHRETHLDPAGEWLQTSLAWRDAVQVCDSCGWWVVEKSVTNQDIHGQVTRIYRAVPSLKRLALSDVSVPTEELKQYLTRNYHARFEIHPKKYEELVASVFRNAGYHVRVTSYSGDDGIDLFLFDANNKELVGVQVKRYRGKIEAGQIRELAGALILNGLTKGVFVTTSEYQKGAKITAERYHDQGVGITLIDAKRFYEKLELATRRPYTELMDPSAPYFRFLTSSQALPLAYEDGVVMGG